jgi:TonB family protein
MEIASAWLWFHPLAWLARSRFRLDQELACDAASLRALPRRTANYARVLLESVAVRPEPALIPWLSEPQLRERLAMIARIPPGLLRRRVGFVVVAMLLAGGLYVAGGEMPATAATRGGSGSTPPTVDISYKNRNPPHYPIAALHKGEQGEVLLVITVDATGKVTDATVDPKRTNAPEILQTAAIQAAENWRFNPGVKNGHAVGGKITVPVTFSLDQWNPPHHSPCPEGFRYKPGTGKSYSCIAPSPAKVSS